jgi:hypothetical protein
VPTTEVPAAAAELRPIKEVVAAAEVTAAADVAATAAVPAETEMLEAKTVGIEPAIAGTQTEGA